MGRRALFWSGAVLVGLIVQQSAVRWFGADANRWLGAALVAVFSRPPRRPCSWKPRGGDEPVAAVARRPPPRRQAPPEAHALLPLARSRAGAP